MVSLRKKDPSSGGFRLASLLRIGRPGGRGGHANNVVGLDIEPGYVAAASARLNGRVVVERAVAASLDAETMREGEVVNVEGLAEALRSLFAAFGLPRKVRLGVANQRTVMRMLEVPPFTERRELEAAVRFQAEDQLPMPLQSAALDFRPLGVVDTPGGPRQRVLLVAAQLETVEKLLAAARAAGLKPEGVDLSAFALVRALFHRTLVPGGEQSRRTVLLNVGGLANLVIAEGLECKFTRVLGRGLESIAQEIAERRALPIDQARELLFRVGAGDGRESAPQAQSRLSIMGSHAVHQDAETLALQMEAERQAQAAAQSAAAAQGVDPSAGIPTLEGQTPLGGPPAAEAADLGGPAGEPPLAPPPAGGEPPTASFGEEGIGEQPPLEGGQLGVGEQVGAQPQEPLPADPAAAGEQLAQPQAGAFGGEPTAVGNTAIGRIEPTASQPGPTETVISPEVAETRLLVEAGVRSIAGEVRNTLDFYAAQEPGPLLEEVVLCGPALDVPGFAALLERYLGLSVRGEQVSGLPGAFGSSSSNLFAVAAGLALEEVVR